MCAVVTPPLLALNLCVYWYLPGLVLKSFGTVLIIIVYVFIL